MIRTVTMMIKELKGRRNEVRPFTISLYYIMPFFHTEIMREIIAFKFDRGDNIKPSLIRSKSMR